MTIYLDNAATTKLDKNVKEYLIQMLDVYGNPSSTHSIGNSAKKFIDISRNNVAKFINCDAENIIFTSSGSAANTLGIIGLKDYRVFYSPTAHKSILKTCESCDYHMSLEVDENGFINLTHLDKCLSGMKMLPALVCIELANSEIGTINDIKQIANIVHEHDGILMVDATGYIPTFKVDVQDLNCDLLTFSSHKLGSLKGVGILYKSSNIQLNPLVYGSQEQGLFGGTENVLGITSLGMAVSLYDYNRTYLSNYLYDELLNNVPNCYIVGSTINRLPNNIYMCFKGISGESLSMLLDNDGIIVSTGSACNSGDLTPSPTLIAIKMTDEDMHSCIRFTLNGQETKEQIDYVVQSVKRNVEKLRILK